MNAPVLTIPPGPKGQPLLGSLSEIQKKGALNFYYDLWRTYGDISAVKLGPMASFSFVRPEHMQQILVRQPEVFIKGERTHGKLRTAIGNGLLTLEGERWFKQRKLMQPTYTPRNVTIFADIMREEAQRLLVEWEKRRSTGDAVIDLNQEMTRVTMRVIARAMFGIDVGANFSEAIAALYTMLEYTVQSVRTIIDVPLFIPTPMNRKLKQSRAIMRKFIENIIAQRRSEGLRDDLLSMLMSARDADTGAQMTDDELHDEVLITIFAGHETTASLLTWALYLLSQNPAIGARLHAELDAALGGRSPTTSDMSSLVYTRMVLDETLRLYSPVALTARDAAIDAEVDNVHIPKGSMVVVLPYATHRHPEFWERPDEFYPEHFTPQAVEQRPRYAYLPFGAGQRICIGVHFALQEAMLIFAEITQHVHVQLVTDEPVETTFLGVVRPARPIYMRVEARTR